MNLLIKKYSFFLTLMALVFSTSYAQAKLVGMKCKSQDAAPIPYYGEFRIVIEYHNDPEHHSVKKLVTGSKIELIPLRRSDVKASIRFKSMAVEITHEEIANSKAFIRIEPDNPEQTYYREFGYTRPEDTVFINCEYLSDEETRNYQRWPVQWP